jgi:PknH-like extracellular domain
VATLVTVRTVLGKWTIGVCALVLAACTTSTTGVPKAAPGAAPPSTTIPPSTAATPPGNSALAGILPDAAQWSAVLGHTVHQGRETLPVDGVDGLGRQDQASQYSDRECLGVVLPLLQSVYQNAPVVGTIGELQSDVTAGAVQLASPADAKSLFATFSTQWQQCQGTTITHSFGGVPIVENVTAVTAADTQLTAAVVSVAGSNPAVTSQRALGLAGSCILDVDAAGDTGAPSAATDSRPAVTIVGLMQANAAKAGCGT